MRPRADEVVAPHVVAMCRSEPHTRAIVEPQPAARLLLLWNLQPLATPDTLHAILAHSPAGSLEQRRDPAIPITAVLAGKLDDRLRECIFVFTPYRTIALRTARLVRQPASPALRQAGARPAGRLGLLASGSTLLRQVRRKPERTLTSVPRVLGIDDWAWKKRHRYGTILCDLEASRVIDLLPDRESETVATWLRKHPGARIISCDRASAYAEAARRAAPKAVQIADRCHLLSNLSEALRTALEPHRRVMTQAARACQAVDLREPLTTDQVMATPAPTAKDRNRKRRHGSYQQVELLIDGGMSQSDAARQLGISLRTVQRWMQAGVFPERTPRCYPHAVNAYASYLDKRLLQGCRNVSQLWLELRQQGYRG